MKNLQYRSAITIFVGITILSFIIYIFLISNISFKELISKDLNHLIKPIGLIITIDIIIWTIFDKWLWKLRIFHSWLVKIPDLNGIWIGTYETKYKTSKIRLEIIQTLTIIGCKIETENGVSVGYATNILYEPEKHQKKLIISYNYELQSNKENKEHRGTYDLIIDEQNKLLKGSYWTNKPSKGKISALKKL